MAERPMRYEVSTFRSPSMISSSNVTRLHLQAPFALWTSSDQGDRGTVRGTDLSGSSAPCVCPLRCETDANRLRRQGSSALAASVGWIVKGRRSRRRTHVAAGP